MRTAIHRLKGKMKIVQSDGRWYLPGQAPKPYGFFQKEDQKE
jgi:hypothetical protein